MTEGLLPDIKQRSQRRPPEAVLICIYFFLAAFLQLYTYFVGIEVLNYGSNSVWAFVIYCVFSPLAGYLLWVRSRRARFAAYIFLTMEIVRSLRGGRIAPLLIAASAILGLQTWRMRKIYPSMLERWKLRKA